MKTLSIRQWATIKRVAMNVNPLVVKKHKIAAKISELNNEYNALIEEIEGHEAGVRALTGGLMSKNLITKRVEDTGKVDKDGKPIKKTVYEPNTKIVVFNKENNVYEIHIPNEEPISESVLPETIDDTETVPEIEVKAGEESPIDPLNLYNEESEENPNL